MSAILNGGAEGRTSRWPLLSAALIDVSDTEWRHVTELVEDGLDIQQHSLMSAILNGGSARGGSHPSDSAALIDVSDTEWRTVVKMFLRMPEAAALIDVSDTEWRVSRAHVQHAVLGSTHGCQRYGMAALFTDGVASPFTIAALIDVSDTEWRLAPVDVFSTTYSAALIDVSDTEWRSFRKGILFSPPFSSTHGCQRYGMAACEREQADADEWQHSLMSAILNGGSNSSVSELTQSAALIDVSDTEWRNLKREGLMSAKEQHSLMSAILNGGR